MKKFLALTLVLCLLTGLCGCLIRLPVPTDPTGSILMEGYVAVDDLPAYDQPSEDGAVEYTYHRGYYVAVYEFDGPWGRTELGWIRWDQLVSDYEDTLIGGETEATDTADTDDSDAGSSGNSGNSGSKPSDDAQSQETTPPESSDSLLPEPTNNSAVIGSWYTVGGSGDHRSFEILDFDSHGYYGTESWSIYAPDLDTVIPDGGFVYRYSLVGNTMYLQPTGSPDPDDNKTVSSSKVSISGNTLVWGGETYYRGDYDDAYAAARAELTPEEPTEPALKWGFTTNNFVLYPGESWQLYRGEVNAKDIVFKSSDESIATISKTGFVEYVSVGAVTLTARYNGETIYCGLTCRPPKATTPPDDATTGSDNSGESSGEGSGGEVG